MQDFDIGFYLAILKRRILLIVSVAGIVLAAAIVVAKVLPPVYTATARMLVETPPIPVELARSTVATSPIELLQILQQQITTRDALLDLARKRDIFRDSTETPTDEDIVRNLQGRIRFDQFPLDLEQRGGGATVYAVSFSADNPVMAADVANELASLIIAKNQRQRTDQAGDTLDFFDQQVEQLDAQLKLIEADILKFKNDNRDTLPENLAFRRSQQESLQERYASLEHEEAELRSRRNMLIVTFTSAGQFPGSTALTPEQQMLADLNRALGEQLTLFQEDSPNIKALRTRIETLQKSVTTTNPSEKRERPEPKNPAFGLELQLSDIDDRLKAITAEKTAINSRIDDLTTSISGTPATETVLNALLRTRENVQTQYNSAIARRAEASRGEQMEVRSDGGRFSLLEKAMPPDKYVKPKRKLIAIAGGVAGLGLGVAIVVLLELLNKTVRRPKDLESLLKARPLGTIPVIRTPTEIKAAIFRRRVTSFAYVALIPVSLTAMHFLYMPLNLALAKLMSSFG